MKKISLLLLLFLTGLLFQCSNKEKTLAVFENSSYQLPKVLIITSGALEGNGKLAEGIVVAMQSFNRNGAMVELETRDILNDIENLKKYKILILSSAIAYHDADRPYSLAYMSDYEIDNIKTFVETGGILIAGDHIGRNKIDGTDRITLYQKLTPENWGLAECFGVSLIERNMKYFGIEGEISENLKGVFKERSKVDLWTLRIDSVYSKNLTELAWWKNNGEKYPALIQNNCKNGMSFLLPSSYLLHPANDGGLWSASQIQSFYDYVLDEFNKKHNCKISLNIWPNACDYAFCVSLNASGNASEYKRVCKLLDENGIEPVFFVRGETDNDIKQYLISSDCNLQSNGFGYINYQNSNFPFVKNDIIKNKNNWNKKFSGFRFPYTRPHFWGLMALNEFNYKYESSIGADNINFFYGSVFPYNIPISKDKYYKMTDILEISPIYHDDYYFYQGIVKQGTYQAEQQLKDVALFEKYLLNYWEYAVKPYNGLMVFMGHPMYVGHNDTTIIPLQKLITKVKADKAWITNLDEVADYWNNLASLSFKIEENNNRLIINISGQEDVEVENLTLNLYKKPNHITIKSGNYKLLDKGSKYQIVFDAINDQQLILSF
ncbi:MAG: hypothetical protein JEY97_04335 [Bacteroidales bacterium]|nr:hypothetical protein [Bacteroidales bacterium]